LKILVIRLSSIGDIILTTPVLKAIKAKYPGATIDFLVMDIFQDAISGGPWVDNLVLFNKDRNRRMTDLLRFGRKLNQSSYDLVIDLHAKIRSIIIASQIRSKILRYKKRAWWKSILVPLRLMRYKVDDTIVKNYFRPLKRIGIYYREEKLHFAFENRDLDAVRAHENFVVMAPGAANATKAWPQEYFARLGQMMSGNIVLIGGGNEYDSFETIRTAIGGACKNLAGRLTLKESGALISKSNYVITNDSGPFHIARGVGKKVFVIFGPTDPGMFEYDSQSILLYEKKDCAPCTLHGDEKCPRSHFACMLDLTPEKAYARIIAELKR
jgi:ADP-heptose:LPS heptosyltransferase